MLATIIARAVVFSAVVAAIGQPDTDALLSRISARVDTYYARARTVVARETVTLQPLGPDLRPTSAARVHEYDVVIEWKPPSATIRREVIDFPDPNERVTLPVSVTTLAVIHNGGVPRLLTTQRFSNYRRFITGARVVK